MIKKIAKSLFIIGVLLLLGSLSAHAATGIEIEGGSSIDTLPEAIEWFINFFLVGVLGIACFVAIIVGGFQIIVAGPDATKAAAGKKTIFWAITGVILGALSYAILEIIVSILNQVFY